MAGVSLAIAGFLVLNEKSSLLKCFAVLPLGFFLVTRNTPPRKYSVYFRGGILKLQGKRLGQNRIMFYETPPNRLGAFSIITTTGPIRVVKPRIIACHSEPALAGVRIRSL